MRPMMRRTLLLMSALAAGIAFAAPKAPKAPKAPAEASVEIVSAQFGVFDASAPGELALEPTNLIPHQIGQRYGWIIEVRTKKRSLAVREEYLMPLPPGTKDEPAPSNGTLTIPLQRRNQVSQRQLVPMNGIIYGEWAIGPGEPAGRRQLQIIIEGELGASFDYEVK